MSEPPLGGNCQYFSMISIQSCQNKILTLEMAQINSEGFLVEPPPHGRDSFNIHIQINSDLSKILFDNFSCTKPL